MYNQLKPYYFDDKINNYVKKYIVPLCKNISPNSITTFGIFMNAIAIYTYFVVSNLHLTALLLIIRILCDNLDGMVAREYKKVSKIGGFLDGFADSILIGTVCYAIFNYMKIPYKFCLAICSSGVMFAYLIYHDAIFIHENLTKNDTFLNTIPFLIYNNTYFAIILVIITMYCFEN